MRINIGAHEERIDWHVRRLGVPWLNEDLRQEARLALCEAASRYDSSRGATFRTYADLRLRGAMLDAIRRWDTLSREHRREVTSAGTAAEWATISLDHEDSEGISLANFLADHARSPEQTAVCAATVARVLRLLPDRLRAVISGVYIEGLPMAEIGRRLEVSESRISQLHRDALRQLRATCGVE